MKKPPKDYSLWQARIIKDRAKRNSKRTNTLATRSERVQAHGAKKPRTAVRTFRVLGYEIIEAPKNIEMVPASVSDVIHFAEILCKKIRVDNKVIIDFSSTQYMSALGSVYVYSEISRILDVDTGVTVKIKTVSTSGGPSASKQVRHVLRNSGISKLCGYPNVPGRNVFSIVKGTDDSNLDAIVEYLMATASLREQFDSKTEFYAQRLATTAINEAMLNVKQHAYPKGAVGFWWAMAAMLDDNLHIALCDRGVGIPKTLSHTKWFSRVWNSHVMRNSAVESDDAEKVKAAMVYTRSSRGTSSGRGLGSRDIQNLVLESGRGHLTIISGKGHYRLDGASKGGTNKEGDATEIDHDVGGTLLQWQIPLRKSTGDKS